MKCNSWKLWVSNIDPRFEFAEDHFQKSKGLKTRLVNKHLHLLPTFCLLPSVLLVRQKLKRDIISFGVALKACQTQSFWQTALNLMEAGFWQGPGNRKIPRCQSALLLDT